MFFSNLFHLTIPFRSIHVVTNGKNSFFFNGWVIFHYMCKPHLIIHSSISGHFTYFHILAIVNSLAENMGLHISFPIRAFVYFG